MDCENKFCIHNKNGKCISGEEIELDIYGMCIDCIYPDIPEEVLDKAKKDFFKIFKRPDDKE